MTDGRKWRHAHGTIQDAHRRQTELSAQLCQLGQTTDKSALNGKPTKTRLVIASHNSAGEKLASGCLVAPPGGEGCGGNRCTPLPTGLIGTSVNMPSELRNNCGIAEEVARRDGGQCTCAGLGCCITADAELVLFLELLLSSLPPPLPDSRLKLEVPRKRALSAEAPTPPTDNHLRCATLVTMYHQKTSQSGMFQKS